METAQDAGELEKEPKRLRLFIGQLSWRMILIRLLVNGLTLIAVALLIPNIYFKDKRIIVVLVMALALGVLNALVKPIVQFLTLPFIFATYGFVIVLINTIQLMLLAILFEERFYVGSLLAALFGGLVMGLVSSFLESLLGLNLPIIPRDAGADRSPARGPATITDILFDEVTGDEAAELAPIEDEAQGAPGADQRAEAAAQAEDGEPVEIDEQEEAASLDESDDEHAGDEK